MPESRQLAAIMFTDIVGYTKLMGNDEKKTFTYLNKNRELQKPIIEKYNGKWIKELGDGVMASFNSVTEAVNAAIKIQEANAKNDFQLRIGVHQGEVVFDANDVFGDTVNLAARLQTAAKPGQIYVSESVHQNVSNKKDVKTVFVKEETLKNIKEPVKIYEVKTTDKSTLTYDPQPKMVQQKSIAVLPFTNMSSDPEQEFFSDGISEEITNMLAQVPGLKVAGRISAFSFKGKAHDLRFIGNELNVNHILEGSVRKSGNKIRITAQLINVNDGYHLWSEKFDRELEDIFDIQDEISEAILNAIKIKLLETDKEAVFKRYTDNAEAYQLYLQGRFHYNKWAGPAALTDAIEYYKKAIDIEHEYALAYTGIASCYLNLWVFNYSPPENCLPQMMEAAHRSMELDPNIAECHTVMARVKMYYDWDLEGAEDEFQKSLELYPNIAETHEQYAYCLGLMGRYKEAVKHAGIAISMDPFSLMNNNQVGMIYWMAKEYALGIEQGKRLVSLEPNFYGGHFILALIYSNMKKYEEAMAEAELAVKTNYSSHTLLIQGMVYGSMGDKEKGREVLQKMQELMSTQGVGNFDLGIVYAGLGDFDKAFEYFEKAIEKKEGLMLYLKYALPYFNNIESDPRTKKLLDKIGIPHN